MTILKLERRGMDFYDNCPEKQVSDFDNFRYFGELDDKHGGKYYIELTIHWREYLNKVNAFLEFSHKYFDGVCHRCGHNTTEPTKKDVLSAINYQFLTDFTEIEFC